MPSLILQSWIRWHCFQSVISNSLSQMCNPEINELCHRIHAYAKLSKTPSSARIASNCVYKLAQTAAVGQTWFANCVQGHVLITPVRHGTVTVHTQLSLNLRIIYDIAWLSARLIRSIHSNSALPTNQRPTPTSTCPAVELPAGASRSDLTRSRSCAKGRFELCVERSTLKII